MKHLKLFATLLLAVGGGNVLAQTWEDYTNKIVNPSFEVTDAASTLKDAWNNTVDGWTISPSSKPDNSQMGVANAETIIQGIAGTFNPSDGNNYLYFRCNWQPDIEFKATQTITDQSFPVGLYKLTCKVANFTSNYSATQYKLSLSDGTTSATNSFAYSKQAWGEQSVVFYKSEDSTPLTLEAYMKPGSQATGQHYCLLLDDFKLEYLSDDELAKATDDNPIDMTNAISNPNIYAETRSSIPKGWTSLFHVSGNQYYTEKTGDTQLEGWSNKAMNVNYAQTIKGLPNGKYILKANVHDSNEVGAVLYATSGNVTETAQMGKDYAVISPNVVEVVDNTLQIGIKVESSTGTWMTGDDFSLTYISDAIEKLTNEANTLLSDDSYKCITGEERTALTNAITAASVSGLKNAINTFESAKVNYQALVDAKALTETQLPYASAAKYTALAAAKNCEAATSASDADAKVNAIVAARRAYVESNGMAEGVEGAEDCSNKLQVTKAETEEMSSVSCSNVRTNNGQGATDSEGNMAAIYFDSTGDFWGSNNLTAQLSQKATELKAGKYLLTVQARGASNLKEFILTAGNDTKILTVQTPSNIFGNGWDDYSLETVVDNSGELNIQIKGTTNAKQAWFSFNDFRLVRIGDLDAVSLDESTSNTIEAGLANVTLKRTLKANEWNTLVLPFDVDAADIKAALGDDVKIVNYDNIDDVNINFVSFGGGIKANVPVLIKPAKVADNNEYSFNGVTLVSGEPIATGTSFDFVGSYNTYNLVDDDYMLYGDKWWKKEAADSYKIKAFRAYIKANTPAAAKSMNLVIDGQTTGLKLNTIDGIVEGETYNLSGQRVADSYKGIVVKNGKKMIKK